MKLSQSFIKTFREVGKEETSRNAELLIRAGYIYKEMAGVYDFLPLGLITLNKIQDIIRDELDAIGCQEMQMTALQNPESWVKTDRWRDDVIDVWFKTKLNAGGELGLAPTKLISPIKTLNNWGSSSNFVLRRKAPNFVISDESARCVATDFAFTFIVRNLYKINGFLFFPTLSCLNIGEPVSNSPMTYKTTMTGSKNNMPKKEKKKSNNLFIIN